MRQPEGYRLEKCLRSTARCEVNLAVRESDDREVVLKAYPRERSADAGGRAAREFDALRAVAPGSAVAALGLDRSTQCPILVLEYFPGVSVERRLDPPAFLDFALRCTRALAGVHQARWVHGGMQPDNALVHPTTGELRLIGFTRASPLGAPLDVQEHAAVDTALYYMAPEMSGRTDRGVDARSDLYALGATFYELLTGLTPFTSLDALELIQAHVARRPRSPLELRPDLPATLARIVLRLLEKEPEDRYQTAEALAVDLESCRDQLARSNRIDDALPLGTADAPYRPLFRRVLYGRTRELETLLGAYCRAEEGQRQLILVSGAPGIGKSALVPELHRPLALDGGYLVQGKFDLYRRHLPYAGFVSILQSLVDQIRSESDARVAAWKDAIGGRLGALAPVLVEFLPHLALLLGESAPPPAVGPRETQKRLALAVERLVGAVAARARPLVLFLDDLQWADAGSLVLLEELLRASDEWPLLLICAYRDGEVDGAHRFGRLMEWLGASEIPVHRLALAPLTTDATAQMLGDALGRSARDCARLAEFVARKSGNNPLLTQQCISHLQRLGALRYERAAGGWRWNDDELAGSGVPDDALGMMMAKLERLPRGPREVLALASCVGDHFDLGPLLELGQLERRTLESALYALSDEGLIAPAREGFRFVHDRIREAAQHLLTSDERRSLHHRAGVLLLERTPARMVTERCFEIADHLNRAHERISASERPKAMSVNITAGRRALAAGAAATAHAYFEAARGLFRPDDWNTDPAQGFALFLDSAEAACQMGAFDPALSLLDTLESRPLDRLQLARLLAKRIAIACLRRQEDELDITLAALRRFGVRWPRKPSALRVRLEILRTDWILRRPLDQRTFPEVDSLNASWTSPLLLVAAGAAALSRAGLLCLATAYTLRTRHRHGAAPGLDHALAGYCTSRIGALATPVGGQRYADAAVDWMQRLPHPVYNPRTEQYLLCFYRAWVQPRREILDGFVRVSEQQRELGDLEFAQYLLRHHARYSALCGESLPALLERFATLQASEQKLLGFSVSHVDAAPYRALQDGLPETPADEHDVEAFLQRAGDTEDQRTSHALHWSIALCFYGRHPLGLALSASIETSFATGLYGSALVDWTLFRGLSALGRATHARSGERRRCLRLARACARKLKGWASCSSDFPHMAQFLEAALARVRGRHEAALDAYATAAERATAQGYRHHAALIHEHRGELLVELGRRSEGEAALRQAIVLYLAWGARAKADALRQASSA